MSMYKQKLTAKERLARWGVTVEHALYSAAGNWYHGLKGFPGAYVDQYGYIIFETEAVYRSCVALKIGRKGDVGVRTGIHSIAGYVRVDARVESPESIGGGEEGTAAAP